VALLLVACTLALSGCGTANSAPTLMGAIPDVLNPATESASVAPPIFDRSKLEPQRPPPLRMFSREDDPSQPFSPNYGSIPLEQVHDAFEGELPSAEDQETWQTELQTVS
jgi:hypothetical protein